MEKTMEKTEAIFYMIKEDEKSFRVLCSKVKPENVESEMEMLSAKENFVRFFGK